MTTTSQIRLEPRECLLTQGERDVLTQVARGLSNGEIAELLAYSTSAVRLFLHRASTKLGARNRAQTVLLALRKGAIKPQDIYSLEELADLLASLGPESIEAVARLAATDLDPR